MNFIGVVIVCPLFIVFNNFIGLWYGEQYLLSTLCVLVFCLLLYYNIIRICLTTFSSGDGLFKETLICVWLEVIINLVLSIILVNYIGILGLIAGTFIAMIIGEFAVCPCILNKAIFKNKISRYYIDCLIFFVILVFNSLVLYKFYKFLTINSMFAWLLTSILIFVLNFGLSLVEFKILKKDQFMSRFLKFRRRR